MSNRKFSLVFASLLVFLILGVIFVSTDVQTQRSAPDQQRRPQDAIMEAQTLQDVPITRPEQRRSGHDQSDVFSAKKAAPSSTAFEAQPDQGKVLGFDFYRDALNSKKPMMTFEEIMQADVAEKPKVMETQQRLLERR
jgi:hypothetical protein